VKPESPNHPRSSSGRRGFLKQATAVGMTAFAAEPVSGPLGAQERSAEPKVRVGVIGCGSVSAHYLPTLKTSPFVEIVSTCDIIYPRAQRAAEKFGVPHSYPHIDTMLDGAPFDLMVNLTDMQEHGRLNQQALESGRHVWSEKPMAGSFAAGQELLALAARKNLKVWGAPTVVLSPQFAFMAKTLAEGKLGRVAAAHASYGHLGPAWSAFFYERGGGSLFDLGVYNITTLTGLLGPARSISAMTSIVTHQRRIDGRGIVNVEDEDNAMLVLNHGSGVLSHVQCGFNYFTPQAHASDNPAHRTLSIVGSGGSMYLAGYDWQPHGVDLATESGRGLVRQVDQPSDYLWQRGAAHMAECLATGKKSLLTPEHALHVVEIMAAAKNSQETGCRIQLQSTFSWPLV
jgi:predicted dehydrogenase